MAAKNESKKPKDVVRLVVEDAAHELRGARAAYQAAREAHANRTAEVNQEFKPHSEATMEARTALRAHERYKEHLPRQAWDEEQRGLQRALEDAEAREAVERERLLKVLVPFRDREQEAAQFVQDLEAEWRVHERTARVAGIDTDALLHGDADGEEE